MLQRAIQKLDQAASEVEGSTIRLVMEQEDHYSLAQNIGKKAASGVIKSVSIEAPFTVVKLEKAS